jgi:serine/threonine-protein kinase
MSDRRLPRFPSPTQRGQSGAGRRHSNPIRIAPNAALGGYRITAPIGRGGFGTIWLAEHRDSGERVAIKVLHAELAVAAEMISRFEREARVIAMIEHPNVVALHDFGELGDGRPYLVMEYLDGTSLRTIIKEGGALSPDEVLSVLEPLASALSAAHAHGVIHRDVKASNVMICEEREGERRVVLLDFGVAKLLEDQGPRITAPLAAVGSPHSMSPEQIRGEEVDARTDVYALGTLAFYMLTGEPPFPGKRGEAMTRHLLDERPRPSDRLDITTAFDDVVTRAMSRDRKDRHDSVEDFVAAFAAAANNRKVCPEAPVPSEDSIRALGLYIDVKMDGSDDDDEVLDDAESVLPLAEVHLSERGYLLVHEVGNSGLFVLPVPESFEEMRSWPRRVVEDASALMSLLEQREGRHPRVHVQVHMHLGEAAKAGDIIDRGPLLEPSSWNTTKKWEDGMWVSSDVASELHLHTTPSSIDL